MHNPVIMYFSLDTTFKWNIELLESLLLCNTMDFVMRSKMSHNPNNCNYFQMVDNPFEGCMISTPC